MPSRGWDVRTPPCDLEDDGPSAFPPTPGVGSFWLFSGDSGAEGPTVQDIVVFLGLDSRVSGSGLERECRRETETERARERERERENKKQHKTNKTWRSGQERKQRHGLSRTNRDANVV